jgi:hypothetical protein
MSAPNNKVLVATLWQRTSDRGNEYLSGFLGKARLIGFRGEPTADGTPTWNIYLQPGKEQEEAAGARAQQPRRTLPETSSAPRPGRVQRWQKPQTVKPAADRPFVDDDISDIGGGR